MSRILEGKVAIVTGAGRGIGRTQAPSRRTPGPAPSDGTLAELDAVSGAGSVRRGT